jgi:ferredoxin-NADP reductase
MSSVPATISWQDAAVTKVTVETPRAKTFALALALPAPHLAGQHYIVRLTAPDGYTAQRSYSIASAPDDGAHIELTVEHLVDGEVTTFLHDEVRVGDELEVRGPIGRWFVWGGQTPATLIGGGSGVVPLMAMLRLARRTGRPDLVRLVVSVRSHDDLYYADELPGPETTIVYTRTAPATASRPAGHLTVDDLQPAPASTTPPSHICGLAASPMATQSVPAARCADDLAFVSSASGRAADSRRGQGASFRRCASR